MGKATRWLKGLLGMKKDKENVENMSKFRERKENKRWSFSVSEKHYPSQSGSTSNIDHSVWLRSLVSETEKEKEQIKHAIAVAAATAAAADAAAAAAQAAIAVVRLTDQGRLLNGEKENNAAVKIQAVFRGSLSRKALRALKGLVKLQALVRGYLVRKRAAATLHSMQALFRAQFAVCSQRALLSSTSTNTTHLKHPSNFRARRSLEKMEESKREYHHRRRLSASYEYDPSFNVLDEIPSPKIIGIDTCKHKSRSRGIHTSISDSGDDHLHSYYPIPCPSSARLSSVPNYPKLDECCKKFASAQNTPRFMNCEEAPVMTPTKSVGGGDGYFGRYSNNYPSYMANTQSFEAKSRSNSAPKQRLERIATRKGVSLNEMMASRLSFTGVRMQRPCLEVEEDDFDY